MKILVLLISNFICSVSIGIASVLVPWTLSETNLGSLFLSSSSAIASLMMFFLFPYVGLVVGRNSKYKLFLIQIGVVFFISLLSSVLFQNESIMLIVLALYFWMMQIYYGFFYVTRNSFVKLNFSTEQQLTLNSLLEIETQFSGFIVSVIILSGLINYNYSNAFLTISMLFLVAFILMVILKQKYANTENIEKNDTLKYDGIVGVLNTYTSIKNKKLIYFSVFSQASFIIVLMCNIVDAYLLNKELNQTISSAGILAIAYTCMAFLGSYVTRYIALKNQLSAVKISMVFMSLSMLYISLYPSYFNLIAITIVHGFCNPCAKVMINNLIMVNSTGSEVSKIFAISQGFTYLFRFLLSSLLGVLLYKFGSSGGYLVLSIFGFICLSFILKNNSIWNDNKHPYSN